MKAGAEWGTINQEGMMKDSEDDRLRKTVESWLPGMIARSGMALPGFTEDRGGPFRCPACGEKLHLFRGDPKLTLKAWVIKDFTKCADFADGGPYPRDAFGFSAALKGITARKSFAELMAAARRQAPLTEEGIAGMKAAHAAAAAKASALQDGNISRIKAAAVMGSAMEPWMMQMYAMRGIDVPALLGIHPELEDRFGWLPRTQLVSARGKEYSVEGLAFMTEGGVQVRLAETAWGKKRFVPKDAVYPDGRPKMRFLTLGPASVFNAQCFGRGLPVVVAEGPVNALAAMTAGSGVNAVATMGAGSHSYLSSLASEFPGVPLIVAYDNDEAGLKGMEGLVAALAEQGCSGSVYGLALPPDGGPHYDLDDWLKDDAEGMRRAVVSAVEGAGAEPAARKKEAGHAGRE